MSPSADPDAIAEKTQPTGGVPHFERPLCEPVDLAPGARIRIERVREGPDAGASGAFPHFHDVHEIVLFGASIPPLISASTHVVAEDRRTRKLLLHRAEIDKLIGAVERKGYTMVPMAMYWKGNKIKVELGLARGKQEHDKRNTLKDKDWQRDKQRTMRAHNKSA